MSFEVIFDTYAENAFDEETKNSSIIWKREWYNENYQKFFPKNKNAFLLDIGPGLGELLMVEREWGYENVYGIDISPSIIQICKEKGLNVELVSNTTEWLLQHKNSFDVITMFDVFEHVPQEQTVELLKACKEALTQTGIMILQVPNIQSAESYLHRYNDLTHVFGYSQHTLEQLFSVVKFETMQFYPCEEYSGGGDDRKKIRRIRSIYWRILRTNREITHNLNPQILTPELFAVVAKSRIELPNHSILGEFEDNIVTWKDIQYYITKMGIRCELIENEERMNRIVRLYEEEINHLKKIIRKQSERLEKLERVCFKENK